MKRKLTNFDEYLEERLKRNPSLKRYLSRAEVAIDIAMQIFSLRKSRGLSQKQVAKIAGIQQSNIARLESADYKGYSLSTLKKIAKALKANLNILFVPKEASSTDIFIHEQWGIYPEIWTTQIPYTTSTEKAFVLDFPSSSIGQQEEEQTSKVNINNDGGPKASAFSLSL